MTTTQENGVGVRKAHAVQDLPSRKHKALKIERLLKLSGRTQPMRLLEIGCGTGAIAHYFATHPALILDVDAVDVVDKRQLIDGYRFSHVDDTSLPFEAESFDVVISNHVIEHVGDEADQIRHLHEIHRVLRKTGVAYLAVPNRWQLTEPHYGVAFLSWMPRRLRTPYLRLRGKGDWYDCEPLTMTALEHLLQACNFKFVNVCVEALKETLQIEQTEGFFPNLLRRMPDAALRTLRPVIPTLIYVLRL